MAFKLVLPNRMSSDPYGDDDSFAFLDGGILAIARGDAEKETEYFAPGEWHRVYADPDHRPGKPKGGGKAFFA